MDQEELFRRLAISLAIGLLIGLERGWQSRDETAGQRTAGLRTFALTGLLGGICGLLSVLSSPIILATGLVVFTAAFTAFAYMEARAEKNFSVTGVVAGILTFVLGAYATLGNEIVAVAAAVVMAILLAMRELLHSWLRNITWVEIRSVLVLLAMSFLLLPLLPDRGIDPWGAINPAEIWLFAIFIAAVSFAGYIGVRIFGERKGIAVAAIAGGLASSTATTISFARLARENPKSTHLLSGGILLAGVTMLARVVALVGVIKIELLPLVIVPVVPCAGVLLVAAGILLRGHSKEDAQNLLIKNPFDMGSVLKLAAIIGVIMMLAEVAADKAGTTGLYLLSIISGFADVDALTLSMARFGGDNIPLDNAAYAILIAVGTNTVSKAVMAGSIGGRQMGFVIGGVSALAIAVLASVAIVF